MSVNCACGSGMFYDNCCLLIHQNISNASTAEQLMRSRYTAFTMAMGDYLMDSHHSSTRTISEKNEIESWAKSVEWDRLEILNTTNGNIKDIKGTVEFKAHFYSNKRNIKVAECIHENSKFIKEDTLWMYLGF
jgi:SEC-C motif-containing protein